MEKNEHDPVIPPALGKDVRDLTQEEYDATYDTGDGGHELPEHIHKLLKGRMP